MKFRLGDTVYDPINEREGRIYETHVNSALNESYYIAYWYSNVSDASLNPHAYFRRYLYYCHEVDNVWIAASSNYSYKIVAVEYAKPYDYSVKHIEPNLPKTCDHVWVDVGFTQSKIVCKNCDVEKA